jgi:hypothetical protein
LSTTSKKKEQKQKKPKNSSSRSTGPTQSCPAYCFRRKKEKKKKEKTRLLDALDPLNHILLIAYVEKVVPPLRVEDAEGKWPVCVSKETRYGAKRDL